MSGKPQIQHWVPRFYLKRFATQGSRTTRNPKVWVTDKAEPQSAPRLASTKRICGQRYLYSPEKPQGERDWAFEERLSHLEDMAANYWEEFCTGELDLSRSDIRTTVAEFISALHLRNKLVFDSIRKVMELRDALFGGPTITSRPSHLAPDEERPDPTHPGRHFVQSTKSLIPKLTDAFFSYRWVLLVNSEIPVVTSDVPVTFIDPRGRRSGPGGKDPMAIFPLSPSTLLCMLKVDQGPEYLIKNCDPQFCQRSNRAMVHFAERFVISANQSDHFSL